jgi:hypothetical protein
MKHTLNLGKINGSLIIDTEKIDEWFEAERQSIDWARKILQERRRSGSIHGKNINAILTQYNENLNPISNKIVRLKDTANENGEFNQKELDSFINCNYSAKKN